MGFHEMSFYRKSLIVVLVCLAFGGFQTSSYLDDLYYQTRPRQPDVAAGRVYPMHVHHGTQVYVARNEELAIELAGPAGFLIFTIALFIYYRR